MDAEQPNWKDHSVLSCFVLCAARQTWPTITCFGGGGGLPIGRPPDRHEPERGPVITALDFRNPLMPGPFGFSH